MLDLIADTVSRGPVLVHSAFGKVATPSPDDPPIARLPEQLFRARAETIESLLDRVLDEHSTLEAWVGSFPIAESTIGRLHSGLVDG